MDRKKEPRRTTSRIKANPQASAEDLLWLKAKDPMAALSHANCPLELWWHLAALFPIEAQESILYRLVILESPERWSEFEDSNLERWLIEACEKPQGAPQLFSLACAEHVLPIFERQFPDDLRLREALRVYRLYLQNEATEAQWLETRNAAQDAVTMASELALKTNKRNEVLSAAQGAVHNAAQAAALAVGAHLPNVGSCFSGQLRGPKDTSQRAARAVSRAATAAFIESTLTRFRKAGAALRASKLTGNQATQTELKNVWDEAVTEVRSTGKAAIIAGDKAYRAERKWQWEQMKSLSLTFRNLTSSVSPTERVRRL